MQTHLRLEVVRIKPYAFTQQNRLKEREGFNQVFAKPVYAKKTPFFSVLACRSEQAQPRLGIVVAKRNVKLAVTRNKVKRLIRESFRQSQSQLNGLDVVVVVKKDFIYDPCNAIDVPGLFPGIFKAVGAKCAPCSKS